MRRRTNRVGLQLVGVALLLCGAAQAQARDACGAGLARSGACIEPVALAPTEIDAAQLLAAVHGDGPRAVTRSLLPAPRALEARPIAADPAEFDATAAPAGDSPMLGLLIAALGVVGFVAHRRSGR